MNDLRDIEALAKEMGLPFDAEDIANGDEAAMNSVLAEVHELQQDACKGMSFAEAISVFIVSVELTLKNAKLLRERIAANLN